MSLLAVATADQRIPMFFATYGRLTATPDTRERPIELLSRAAELLHDDSDCHLCLIDRDLDNDAGVWVTELWADRAAHAASLERGDVRALIGEAAPQLTAQPQQVRLEPVASKGLPTQRDAHW